MKILLLLTLQLTNQLLKYSFIISALLIFVIISIYLINHFFDINIINTIYCMDNISSDSSNEINNITKISSKSDKIIESIKDTTETNLTKIKIPKKIIIEHKHTIDGRLLILPTLVGT